MWYDTLTTAQFLLGVVVGVAVGALGGAISSGAVHRAYREHWKSPQIRAEFPGGTKILELQRGQTESVKVYLYEKRDVGFKFQGLRLRLRNGVTLNNAKLDGTSIGPEGIHRQPAASGRTDRPTETDRRSWESVEILPPWPAFMYSAFGVVELSLSVPDAISRTRFDIRPRTSPNDLTTEKNWESLELVIVN
jgi:hypothetical protein